MSYAIIGSGICNIGYVYASGKMCLFKPLYAPTSMTAAPDGNLWVCGTTKLVRIA